VDQACSSPAWATTGEAKRWSSHLRGRADTIAFTEGMGFHDGRGQRYAPPYLGSLPFDAAPEAVAATDTFTAGVDAAEKLRAGARGP
jgi:hypothetical protein